MLNDFLLLWKLWMMVIRINVHWMKKNRIIHVLYSWKFILPRQYTREEKKYFSSRYLFFFTFIFWMHSHTHSHFHPHWSDSYNVAMFWSCFIWMYAIKVGNFTVYVSAPRIQSSRTNNIRAPHETMYFLSSTHIISSIFGGVCHNSTLSCARIENTCSPSSCEFSIFV